MHICSCFNKHKQQVVKQSMKLPRLTSTNKKAMTTYRKKLIPVYSKRQIKHANKHITRLLKSVYPGQMNDYVMLRLCHVAGPQDVPIDAKLAGIAKKLSDLGFKSFGVDVGNMHDDNTEGFILLASKPTTKARNDLIAELRKRFATCKTKVVRNKRPIENLPGVLYLVTTGPDSVALRFQMTFVGALEDALRVSSKDLQALPGTISAKLPEKVRKKLPFVFWGEKQRTRYQAALKRLFRIGPDFTDVETNNS